MGANPALATVDPWWQPDFCQVDVTLEMHGLMGLFFSGLAVRRIELGEKAREEQTTW